MPAEYSEFTYDYRIHGNFKDWLEAKDNDDGWELITVMRMRSNEVDKHICMCVFRKKTV